MFPHLLLTRLMPSAVYKRSTVPVFKAHGLVQASISDCATETFSAIRTVRSLKSLPHNSLCFLCEKFRISLVVLKLNIFSFGLGLGCIALVVEEIFFFSLSLSIQVRSFGGEKRQMSMFGSWVSYWLCMRIPQIIFL